MEAAGKRMHIYWVPGQKGISVKEIADENAKSVWLSILYRLQLTDITCETYNNND